MTTSFGRCNFIHVYIDVLIANKNEKSINHTYAKYSKLNYYNLKLNFDVYT